MITFISYVFFTITVIPNPYPRSVTFFFFINLSFCFFPVSFLFFYTSAKMTLRAKVSSCIFDPFPHNFDVTLIAFKNILSKAKTII